MAKSVWITAAVTGGIHTPSMSPYLPVTPRQIIAVMGGGIIPEQDFQALYDAGIKAIFTPGAPLESIVGWINENIKPKS